MFFVFMGSVVQYTAGGTQELSLVTAPPQHTLPTILVESKVFGFIEIFYK